MTVTGPDFVSLQVRDLERAARFYQDGLGLSREPLPGTDLDAGPGPGTGVGLWFRCDGVQALHAKLVELGTPILKGPVPGPFGTTFTLSDPDGYAVTIHGED